MISFMNCKHHIITYSNGYQTGAQKKKQKTKRKRVELLYTGASHIQAHYYLCWLLKIWSVCLCHSVSLSTNENNAPTRFIQCYVSHIPSSIDTIAKGIHSWFTALGSQDSGQLFALCSHIICSQLLCLWQ